MLEDRSYVPARAPPEGKPLRRGELSQRERGERPFRRWPYFIFYLFWVTVVVNLLIAMGRSLQLNGAPGSFWTLARLPGNISDWFCFFFAAAVVVSQAAHVTLAYVSWR